VTSRCHQRDFDLVVAKKRREGLASSRRRRRKLRELRERQDYMRLGRDTGCQ
jgi:hypothetical protein